MIKKESEEKGFLIQLITKIDDNHWVPKESVKAVTLSEIKNQ